MTNSMTLKLQLEFCIFLLKWYNISNLYKNWWGKYWFSTSYYSKNFTFKILTPVEAMFCLTLANTFYHLVTTALMLQTLQCASDLILINSYFDHGCIIQTDGGQMHTILYTAFALESIQNIYRGYVSLTSLLSSNFSLPFTYLKVSFLTSFSNGQTNLCLTIKVNILDKSFFG